jgi:hypothetical protein
MRQIKLTRDQNRYLPSIDHNRIFYFAGVDEHDDEDHEEMEENNVEES